MEFLGDIQRFEGGRSGRKVTAFAGLAVMQFSSGQKQRNWSISKAGPPLLRFYLHFVALTAVHFDGPFKGFYNRLASQLSLPRSVKETRSLIYRKALNSNLIHGRSIEEMIATSVYASASPRYLPRTLDEIAAEIIMSKKELGRAYRLLLRSILRINSENILIILVLKHHSDSITGSRSQSSTRAHPLSIICVC